MLRVLALASFEGSKGLTKYGLECRSGVARQTVYDSIPKLKLRGEIEVADRGKSRTGLDIEWYRLTERGWLSAAILNPDHPHLTERARKMIGRRFDELEETIQTRREEQFQRWLQLIGPPLKTRRAPAGWFFRLEIVANSKGLVTSRVQTGFRRLRQQS
jgi:DNA-binding PadR family transcriptional regulator